MSPLLSVPICLIVTHLSGAIDQLDESTIVFCGAFGRYVVAYGEAAVGPGSSFRLANFSSIAEGINLK